MVAWALVTPVAIGWVVGWVLLKLGFSVVVFVGFTEALAWGVNYIKQTIIDLPPIVEGMLGILRIDQCINIVVAAFTINAAMTVLRRIA